MFVARRVYVFAINLGGKKEKKRKKEKKTRTVSIYSVADRRL